MIALDPIRDTTDRLSWGWISLMYGIYLGRWVEPDEASQITKQPPATLRGWAEAGVISRVLEAEKSEVRYLATELQIIGGIFPEQLTVTLDMLKEHLDSEMGGTE